MNLILGLRIQLQKNALAPVRFAHSRARPIRVCMDQDKRNVVRHQAICPHPYFVPDRLLSEKVWLDSLVSLFE